jgi:hypothetical protein
MRSSLRVDGLSVFSASFRLYWTQGPELAEWALMRQRLDCSDSLCGVSWVLSLRSERGLVGLVTHLDALLSQRLELL